MPHEPVTIRSTFAPHDKFGDPDRVVVEEYIAPADGDGNVAVDPYKEADASVARELEHYLNQHFPAAYGWKGFSDLAKRVIGLRLPVLMPENVWYVINLRTHPDYQPVIVRAAGELLERYRLPRDRFDLGAFLESRAKYSGLIFPWRHRGIRGVPG